MEFYFVANGVTGDARKKAAFLSAIGPSTYKLLRSLIAPTTVQDADLVDIITALRNHFEPQPSAIVQRARLAQYLSELRAIAGLCNFGDKLDDMLRDRLACSINNSAMQRRLLTEGDALSLSDAVKHTMSMELAEKDAQDLKGEKGTMPEETVNNVGAKIRPRHCRLAVNRDRRTTTGSHLQGSQCYRCFGRGHSPDNCHFKTEKCFSCQNVGHIQRACRSAKQRQSVKPPAQSKQPIRNVPEDRQKPKEADEYEDLPLMNVYAINHKPLMVSLEVENRAVQMELDIGAAVSLVSHKTYKKLQLSNKPLEKSTMQLTTYSSESIKVQEVVNVDVNCEGQQATVPLYVVEGNGPDLFGRNWLEVFKLNWNKICTVHNQALKEILDRRESI